MEEDQIVLDVETSPDFTLLKSMQRKLNPKLWGKTDSTIFRKPHNISESKKNLFEPSIISIGPFHRDNPCLQALEEQKWRFLHDFLSRGISLKSCIEEMQSLETKTRSCYSQTFDNIKSNAFVEMMLLDGCFILEFISKMSREEALDHGSNDFGWYSKFVQRDLLLLENQIPFFIVEKLFQILNQQVPIKHFVKNLACIFFCRSKTMDFIHPIFPYSDSTYYIDTDSTYYIDIDSEISDPPTEIHHLVHLCYHSLVPKIEKPVVLRSKSSTTSSISAKVIPSAAELKWKGLKFKPQSNPKHMLDISFKNGVLKIPKLVITAENKTILANLVAFEKSEHAKEGSPFTRFVIFLDNLVNTGYDVRILQECGIMENGLDSVKDATEFINQFIEVDIFERDHYLAELYMNVNGYIEANWAKSRWKKQRAKLIREYFSSPWKTISVVAAFILLALTCVQTFYAVYAYKFPPSS